MRWRARGGRGGGWRGAAARGRGRAGHPLPHPTTPSPPPSFGNDGYIDLEVTHWEYWHKKGGDGIDLQRVAFVAVERRDAAAAAAAAAAGGCPLDAAGVVRLLDFEQVDYNRREGFNATFFNGRLLELVPRYAGRGAWSLLYVNCEAGQAVTSFLVRASLYSVAPGGVRDYLPAGEGPLPAVYAAAAASFAAGGLIWLATLAAHARALHPVHGVLTAAAALHGLALASARVAAARTRAAGAAPGWPAGAAAAGALAAVAPLGVAALIGGGWAPARALLPRRERALAAVALPLQACAALGLSAMAALAPGAPSTGPAAAVLHAAGGGAAFAVLLAVARAAASARAASRSDPRAARAAAGLDVFRRYYAAVAVNAYVVAAAVAVARGALPARLAWAPTAAVQAGWLLLWATVASQFAPGPRCEYVTLTRRPTRGEAELVRARSS